MWETGGREGSQSQPPPPTPMHSAMVLLWTQTVWDCARQIASEDVKRLPHSLGSHYCHYRQSPAAKGLLIRRKHWKLESGQRKPWLCCLALEEGPSREPLSLQGDRCVPPQVPAEGTAQPRGMFCWPWLYLPQEKASELGHLAALALWQNVTEFRTAWTALALRSHSS